MFVDRAHSPTYPRWRRTHNAWPRVFLVTALIGAVSGWENRVAAQIDPFRSSSPFGGGSAPSTSLSIATREDPTATQERDPVVLAIRESNPTTPPELTRALLAMMNHGRPDEARKYLFQLREANPGKDTLAEVHRQFGSAFFFRLSQYQPLAPEGVELARAVFDAAHQTAVDPARLQAWVRELSSPAGSVRGTALRGLAAASTNALAPMIQTLADQGRSGEHAAVRDALVLLGDVTVEPLIGVLEAPDESLVAQSVEVLGRLRAQRALKYLVRPFVSEKSSAALREAARVALHRIVGATPNRDEAERYLYEITASFSSGALPGKANHEERIELWHWDPTAQSSTARHYTTRAASFVVSARLASDLFELDPANPEYQRLFLSTSLESAKLVAGLHRPLPKGPAYSAAAAAGPAAVEEVLAYAMHSDHVAAAIAAAEVLGEIGNEQFLYSSDGRPRTLALALQHADRRLRFAAVNAVLKFDPQQPFPGSSHVSQVLAYLLRTSGQQRVLIGHPRIEQARSLVGMLGQSDIEGDTASTGRQFFELAVANPDYDFLLLSDAVDEPHFQEVLQMIRRDPRTAKLPVGLIAREENLARMKRFAHQDPFVDVFLWPYDVTGLAYTAGRLILLAGDNFVSRHEKTNHAVAALQAMLRMAQQPEKDTYDDLMRHQEAVIAALEMPELAPQAIPLLALLGSPRMQRMLVEFASQGTRPLAHRQAAAEAFANAVRRRGTLLTTDEIRMQYTRYNQSALLDQGTQAVLGSILDTLEAKRDQEDQRRPQRGASSTPRKAVPFAKLSTD